MNDIQIINVPINTQYTWYFYLTDGNTIGAPNTGVTITTGNSKISKNGAAFVNTTNLPTELGYGWYKLVLTASEMNYTDIILAVSQGTSMCASAWICTNSVGGASLTAAQVWDYLISSGFTVGSIGAFLSSLTTAPTAASIQSYLQANPITVQAVDNPVTVSSPLTAAQVWDYLASSATESGTIGAFIQSELNSLVSAGSSPTLAQIQQVIQNAIITFGKN